MRVRGEGSTLNGFLDKGSRLKGELHFEETFRVDGRFEGKIPSGGELILGDSAEVEAEVHVARVSINGVFRGTIDASERVEIHPRARVSGEIRTPILSIEEGAFFEGSCRMATDASTNLVEMPPSALRK
jgi:cytoskeletal protein CcmA (bactofilin family)